MNVKIAKVSLTSLQTLWFNTGSLCNLTCANCYIESTPTNHRLAFLTQDDITPFLDEIDACGETKYIGFTGGEPFLNPHIFDLLESVLERGYKILILTNGLKPFLRSHILKRLLSLEALYGEKIEIRVSLDDYLRVIHEKERGPHTWKPTLEALRWLSFYGFSISVAGRLSHGVDDEGEKRAGYASLFEDEDIDIQAFDQKKLILFAEMSQADAPHITDACWDKIGMKSEDVMCASSRMVVKRQRQEKAVVLACTLIAYEQEFEMGKTLKDARKDVYLKHHFCAQFCVLGGSSCTG